MIFARRSIQRFIDRLSKALPQDIAEKLVRNLNRNDRASLDFEWEVAVTFALDRLGEIDYESDHGGESLPDVTFRLSGQETVCFVADVATVSDRGREEENPIRMLSDFLHEKARALGMPGGFQYRVEGDQTGKRFGDRKVKLAMPHRKKLRVFLEKHVTPRLREIKETELAEAEIPISEPYRMSITYRKDATASGGSHLSYTTAYSLTRNPVYTSLKGKARQLSRSGFEKRKGIILCDGSCELLRSQLRWGGNYSGQEIIEDFLRQNSSISFVVTLRVEQSHRGVFDRSHDRRLKIKVFQNQTARFTLDDEISQLLQQIPDLLPMPVNTAINAVYGIEAGKYGIGKTHYGGSTVSSGINSASIRISSRTLLGLLAGTTDPSRFAEDHWPDRIGTTEGTNNPFAAAVARGMTIEAVAVEHKEDEDDDWITFEISWPDVAMTPFQLR